MSQAQQTEPIQKSECQKPSKPNQLRKVNVKSPANRTNSEKWMSKAQQTEPIQKSECQKQSKANQTNW